MTIDSWFALDIYHHDLEQAASHNPDLAARIAALLDGAGEKRTGEGASWTGDLHAVDLLHLDPAFDWLTGEVGEHARRYLEGLGYATGKLAIHVQRAWPVVAGRGQTVSRHRHHTAHLSAVYYVAAGEDAGRIVFHDASGHAEVAPGIAAGRTEVFSTTPTGNPTHAAYRPEPGRLLLFPARQPHSVEANDSDEARISIAYDLVISGRDGAQAGRDEFLMPSPARWRQILPDRPSPTAPRRPSDAIDLVSFAETGGHSRLTLAASAGHPLWEMNRLGDVSPPAAWRAYRADLDALAPEDWHHRAPGVSVWAGGARWQGFADAARRLAGFAQNAGLALDGAWLGQPQIHRLVGAEADRPVFGAAHLNLWLRIGHDDGAVTLTWGDSAKPLAAGSMAVVPGCRHHHLSGSGTLLHFEAWLPGAARIMSPPGAGEPAWQEALLFDQWTASPLHTPPMPAALIEEKRATLARRDQRRRRAAATPVVRRFLIDNGDPDSADTDDIAAIAALGRGGADAARMVRTVGLAPADCGTLVAFADDHLTANTADTVDGEPEFQLDISPDLLSRLVGQKVAQNLLTLPGRHFAEAPKGLPRSLFIRRYSPESRPFIAFHADLAGHTLNVALNDPHAYDGGRLVYLEGGRLIAQTPGIGEALLHPGALVHGVSCVTRGRRYSLIAFYVEDRSEGHTS